MRTNKLTSGWSTKDRILKKILVCVNSILGRFGVVLCSTIMNVEKKRPPYILRTYDFVRWSALELIAYEIYENNRIGAVAELGVFQGDFAKIINRVFPDRKLYLFDTFEGFSEKDIKIEQKMNIYSKQHDFSNTNIDIVLKRMAYPENCIIKKGYFPETAKDLEETFVFVSLDADLYEPLYSGLKYFYPRLTKGGYIMIHDYNNTEYTGAKEAVKQFCHETGVLYFPLPDNCGSVVFLNS
jgi:O-methyltransferase